MQRFLYPLLPLSLGVPLFRVCFELVLLFLRLRLLVADAAAAALQSLCLKIV